MIIADRVQETTTTTGTGTITLAGAKAGFQSFTAALTDGDQTFYCIEDGTSWEVGLGTFTASGTTLSRDTIYDSSNAGAAVNWGAGDKNVFITVPANVEPYLSFATLPASEAVTKGAPVAIATDGTVKEVEETGLTAGVGTDDAWESDSQGIYSYALAWDSLNNRIWIAWRSQSGWISVNCGVVSGENITWETPFYCNENDTTNHIDLIETLPGVMAIYYGNGTSVKSYAVTWDIDQIVGQSFASTNILPSTVDRVAASWDAGAGRACVFATGTNGTVYGLAGTANTDPFAGVTNDVALGSAGDDGRICAIYAGSHWGVESLSNGGPLINFASVSGTTVTDQGLNVTNYDHGRYDFDIVWVESLSRAVFSYRNVSNNRGHLMLLSKSGATTTEEANVVFNLDPTYETAVTWSPTDSRGVVFYRDGGNNNYLTATTFSLTASSITILDTFVVRSVDARGPICTHLPDDARDVLAFWDNTVPVENFSVVWRHSQTTSNVADFIGFAIDGASASGSVPVATKGMITKSQVSLTPMTTYYIDADGTLSTSDTGYAVAGYALSSTTMRVME